MKWKKQHYHWHSGNWLLVIINAHTPAFCFDNHHKKQFWQSPQKCPREIMMYRAIRLFMGCCSDIQTCARKMNACRYSSRLSMHSDCATLQHTLQHTIQHTLHTHCTHFATRTAAHTAEHIATYVAIASDLLCKVIMFYTDNHNKLCSDYFQSSFVPLIESLSSLDPCGIESSVLRHIFTRWI